MVEDVIIFTKVIEFKSIIIELLNLYVEQITFIFHREKYEYLPLNIYDRYEWYEFSSFYCIWYGIFSRNWYIFAQRCNKQNV